VAAPLTTHFWSYHRTRNSYKHSRRRKHSTSWSDRACRSKGWLFAPTV